MAKSLLEIQKAVRILESKAQDLSNDIASISDDIEEFRNTGNTGSIDYETISLMATHLSFGKHPIGKLTDTHAQQLYLELLLSIVQADIGSNNTADRLIFVQWLLVQSKLEISLEDLLKEALCVSNADFGDAVVSIPKQYRTQLIVDALITANICGPTNAELLSYIVSLCSILGIEKEQLRLLSLCSKAILKQKLEKMKKADLDAVLTLAKQFRHYLSNEVIHTGLNSQRTIAVEKADSQCTAFRWKVKQSEAVEKGMVVATYKEGSSWSNQTVEIKAPCAGTIFQFRDSCINYGVIAHESDNKESIKAWVKGRR
jgi:hypothetical protein